MHLLDLLPPIRARVAVLGRRPALHLIHDCLTEKVEKFVAFRPPFIIGSMAPEGARANALTYVDPTQVLRFLHAEGFLSNVPDEDYFALPGLLEADVAAYAQSWRRPPDVTEAFITEAIRSCREGRPSASAQATLANVAPRIVPA